MVALQMSIGTLNDLLDAAHDAGRIPPKPIPAGLVSAAAARTVWVGTGVLGLLLILPSGALTLAVALLGLAIGYGYDRFAKGTAWSWLPFAIGIPLVPVFGWVGTGQPLPASFAVLVPCAMLAGAAIAIANASADVELDTASGSVSVAARLGLERAWLLHAALLGVAVAVVLWTLMASGPEIGPVVAAIAGVAVVLGGVTLGATVGERRASPGQRRLAWEMEAAGLGVVATAWLVGLAG